MTVRRIGREERASLMRLRAQWRGRSTVGLRSLFVAGALAVIRYAKLHGSNHRPWVTALLARRPTKVAAIALANKLARMAWALMARGERYNYLVALRP
jgi:transposase